jgi:putative transposase
VKPVDQPEPVVGVDLGVRTLAALSTGEFITGPKSHAAALKRLRRANKALARKSRFSANWRKQKARLARIHARIPNVRSDSTHKLTTRLAKTFKAIGIEDLNVRGMAKDRRIARGVMDGGLFEFRRQLTYRRGSTVRASLLPAGGFLRARPVLAAASSRRRWLGRRSGSAATTVVSRLRAILTPR